MCGGGGLITRIHTCADIISCTNSMGEEEIVAIDSLYFLSWWSSYQFRTRLVLHGVRVCEGCVRVCEGV